MISLSSFAYTEGILTQWFKSHRGRKYEPLSSFDYTEGIWTQRHRVTEVYLIRLFSSFAYTEGIWTQSVSVEQLEYWVESDMLYSEVDLYERWF